MTTTRLLSDSEAFRDLKNEISQELGFIDERLVLADPQLLFCTLAELKSILSSKAKGYFVIKDRLKHGIFEWLSGDYSTQVSRDALGGVYQPTADDPQGKVGVWKRIESGEVCPEWWGAKGDGKTITDAIIVKDSNELTSASGTFSASDVGKTIVVAGAGPANAATVDGQSPLVTTVAAFVSPTKLVLTSPAKTAVSAKMALLGSDDKNAFSAACRFATLLGGTLLLRGVTYTVSDQFVLQPNVTIRGNGSGVSCIKRFPASDVDNDSSTVIRFGYDNPQGGRITLEDVTIWGTNWGWLKQGGDQCVSIGQADRVYVNRIEVAYARLFSLSIGYANEVTVTNSYVHHGMRDGMNISGTKGVVLVEGNTIEYIGDDCIAVHVPTNVYDGVFMPSVRIVNNRIKQSLGIKVLGGKNVVVMGNQLDCYHGYGVYFGMDSFYREGITSAWAIDISHNTLINGLPNYVFGSASVINSSIFIESFETVGTGANAVTTRQGYYNAATNKMATPGKYMHLAGPTYPVAPCQNVNITNNIVRATLDYAVAKFSDYGLGTIWHANGPLDPACSGLTRTLEGVRLSGDFDSISIGNNIFDGVANCLKVNPSQRANKIDFLQNTCIRSDNGVLILPYTLTSLFYASISICDNSFDLDPFMEMTNRNINGSWDVNDGDNGFGVLSIGTSGVMVSRNKFSNCRRAWKYFGGGGISLDKNIYIWDWSINDKANTSPKGIGLPIQEDYFNAIHVFRYSDPTKSNYLKYSDVVDSGLLKYSQNRPSVGYFAVGQFVEASFGNVNVYDANNRRLVGWRRISWGNTHDAQDWRAEYVFSS